MPIFFRLRLVPDSGKFELLIGESKRTAERKEVDVAEIQSWLDSLHSTSQEIHIGNYRIELNDVSRARFLEYIELILDGSEEFYRTQ